MTGNLLVTPDKLREAAQVFSEKGSEVKQTTGEMLELVHSLQKTWAGDAGNAYQTKFNSLESSMNAMFKMIQDHADNLQEMARNYESAENANVQTSNSLPSDVLS